MKYTKYFGGVARNQGVPFLNTNNFAIFMNIVHLEGSINSLNTVKSKAKGTDEFYKYDVQIFKYEERLSKLTEGLEPYELLEKLVRDVHSS